MLFVQMIGRGLRTADGKADCLILDHSDNHIRLGFVTDIHHDELDDGKPRRQTARRRTSEALPKKCPKCTFLKPPKMLVCPVLRLQAGAEVQRRQSRRRADRVHRSRRAVRRGVAGSGQGAGSIQELKGYAVNRGYQARLGRPIKFKEKFGHWPNGLDHLPPIDPITGDVQLDRVRARSPGRGGSRAMTRCRSPACENAPAAAGTAF